MKAEVLTLPQAWSVHDRIREDSRVRWAKEPDGIESQLRALTLTPLPSHRVWSDAYLAAFSLAGDFTFVTFDLGFQAFDGLSLHIPE